LDSKKIKKQFEIDIASALTYIHGDTLPCSDEKGWFVITVDTYPLGWGKASGGMMKNHYPKGLRKNF
jgi:NOL1/NOP2/fmu family ribosome biogenesis protein